MELPITTVSEVNCTPAEKPSDELTLDDVVSMLSNNTDTAAQLNEQFPPGLYKVGNDAILEPAILPQQTANIKIYQPTAEQLAVLPDSTQSYQPIGGGLPTHDVIASSSGLMECQNLEHQTRTGITFYVFEYYFTYLYYENVTQT